VWGNNFFFGPFAAAATFPGAAGTPAFYDTAEKRKSRFLGQKRAFAPFNREYARARERNPERVSWTHRKKTANFLKKYEKDHQHFGLRNAVYYED